MPAEPPRAGRLGASGSGGALPWEDPAWLLAWARWVLLLFPLLLYAGSLGNDFLVDDSIIVASNTRLQPGQTPLEIFRRPEQFADFTLPYYRPLTNLTYWIDTQLWGGSPVGFHVTNWLLHAGVTLLTFELMRTLTGGLRAGFLTGLLFAAHPMHTESVDMVQGRTDLLATALLLLSLLAALHMAQGDSRGKGVAWGGASVAALVAALLTKETGITWPLLLLGLWWATARADRASWSRWGALLLGGSGAILAYLLVRLAVLGAVAPGGTEGFHLGRLGLMPITLTTYVWWLLWPFTFSFIWPLSAPAGWADARLLGSLTALLAIVCSSAWLARRHRLSAFALGWIFLALLPVANLIPIPGFALAQRYLYLPSVGFCMFLGLGLDWIWRTASRPAIGLWLGGAVVGLLIAFSVATQLRTAQWADPLSVYEQMATRAPTSFFAQSTLGLEYLRRGQLHEATLALGRACDLESTNPRAWNNLGIALARTGRLGGARAAYERAIALSPGHARAHENLGHVLLALGLREQAEAAFQRARTLSGR